MRVLIFLLCLLPQIAFAQSFETMAIVHDGRVKPMDTFARQVLESIYGQDSFEGQTASEWMQGIVADPQNAVQKKIFFIENETLKNKLGLNADQNYFNAQQLATVFAPLEKEVASLTATENLTPNEMALLELYDKTVVFATLLRGEGIIVPSEVDKAMRSRLKAEVLYNQWRPFLWVKWGYGFAVFLGLIAFFAPPPSLPPRGGGDTKSWKFIS